MFSTLTRSIVAAGEMLQQLCCTALLGSPAVILIDERVQQVSLAVVPKSRRPRTAHVH